jgi:hypothetical protein
VDRKYFLVLGGCLSAVLGIILFYPFDLFLVNVLTLVGFGPVFPAARFLLTADFFCDSLIDLALASGTHFGYLRFDPFDLPQGWYFPSFLGAPMSTHFSATHFLSPFFAIVNFSL